ncbi:MAG: GDP-mannose 4,6-dehydratase [Myxococcales bacterium]|nr:GDP-mannose 4,6-dehydratase [Myxococcales bacterium]
MKVALVTGITGQDGSYLTELLLAKGYHVHGLIRRASNFNTQRIDHLLFEGAHEPARNLTLHYGDLTDGTGMRRVLDLVKPDEIYNLAAQSHVRVSFDHPEYTADVIGTGFLRLLEAARDHMATSKAEIRIYQAGTSEMFGSAAPPQSERTPFHPRSPYAVSKVAAHWYGVNYREAYGMFVANGILFNHESPRRGETFVTRKVTRAVGRIAVGLQERLALGNLDAKRDWGFAGDFVEAMWRMLQQDRPGDFVIATGESNSVADLLDVAFDVIGENWRRYVVTIPRYERPAEVEHLRGDATKAREELGWRHSLSFEELIRKMVDHDLKLARRERALQDAGFDISRG